MTFVNIRDVPKKPGLKIAKKLDDQHVLGSEGSGAAITGAEKTGIIVQTYAPGGSHDPHEHDDKEQVFLVISGKGQMDIGGEIFPIEKGTVLYAPPKVRHSTQNTSDDDLVMMLISVDLS